MDLDKLLWIILRLLIFAVIGAAIYLLVITFVGDMDATVPEIPKPPKIGAIETIDTEFLFVA
ncbi:hypothetical protein ACFOQM_04095 [Paenibacillus sp. GCM10012307]|uniref:Uncharacterized protein n=1 Tax=Paenibacillus roseus TaxID=2798579 RepID=A0A934IZE2_9BACL|nr:hypothetical protein [Paenibacillus roseus]MBJ6360494.1 hypothetical protein [Paenibacillus roseus]